MFGLCKGCRRELPEEQFELKPKSTTHKRKAFCRSCCGEFRARARQHAREMRLLGPKEVYIGASYAGRQLWLERAGFSSYSEYLASPLWHEIRKRVYSLKGRDCFLCGSPATELHHNRYHKNDLLGRKLRFINPICRHCHESIEFSDGRKQSVRQAAAAFRKLRKAKRRSNPKGKPEE